MPDDLSRPAVRVLVGTCVLSCLLLLAPRADAETRPPRQGTDDYRLLQRLLKEATPSSVLEGGWTVEGPTHVVHSTISKEYAAFAAVHLSKFHKRFVSIFRETFKDTKKPIAYAFPTEKEYLAFSPESKGTQGRFMVRGGKDGLKKDLAWFSTPPGEKDFYKTDYGVVQHEATHQLLDAYTDNQSIPVWFHEGCATFFESWNLDESNAKNILSGASERYALGVCLTYPRQKPAPPLAEYWIGPRKLLLLERLERPGPGGKAGDKDREFKAQMVIQQQYNEAWCAMTFFIDHDVGREVFGLFVGAFRDGKHLSDIQSTYYKEEFLSSFEREWYKFIEKKVIGKWEMPTVGGKKLRVGDGASPPAKTVGFPLTDDRRGDLFLVKADAGVVPRTFAGEKWWMLKAWGVPVKFYQEAWLEAPRLVARGQVPIIASAYGLVAFDGPPGSRTRFFLLIPAWAPVSWDEKFAGRLQQAAAGLVEKW